MEWNSNKLNWKKQMKMEKMEFGKKIKQISYCPINDMCLVCICLHFLENVTVM